MAEVTKEDLNRAGYKYYAFISYNHRDEKWAKSLQSRLRRYRLPSVARTELGGDIRIDPVFRYKTNLPVAHLREQIKEELDRSKYLIVICSPNSAKPNIKGEHWVNDEVMRFVKLERTDRIVPVIVDGVPNSSDDRECFCPALRETEISAVNLVEGSRFDRKHEFLRLVAKLLGIDPAQLIREDYEDERRDRIKKFFCWLPLILLALVGGIFAWDALRPVENYYANYVDSYGLPEGVFPLAKDELRGRHIHYRFEYKGIRFGKSIHADSADWSFVNLFGCQRVLHRVVQSNSAGQPRVWDHTEYSDRSPILEFEYNNSILRQIVHQTSSGKFERRLVLSDDETAVNSSVELKNEKSFQSLMAASVVTGGGFLNGNGVGRSEIAQYQLKRDGKGREIERRFKDSTGYKSVSDSEGVYGFSYKLDERGRTEELWYLDANGYRRENKKGVAGRKYHYTGRNMDRAEYVNSSGAATPGHGGWMVCVDEFDAFDNNTHSVFLDAEGKRAVTTFGCVEVRQEYDVSGNAVSYSCLGMDGKPVSRKETGAGWRSEQDEWGGKGLVNPLLFFLDAEPPPSIKEECAGWKCEYDERGYMVCRSYVGVNGNLVRLRNGNAGYKCEYDSCGNVTCCTYFDVDGKPVSLENGPAGFRFEYDKRRNMTRCLFLNEKGAVCSEKGAGFCCEYDGRGNVTQCLFLGEDEKPMLMGGLGFAGFRYEYDGRGNVTRLSFIGKDGGLTAGLDGVAELHNEYDETGNCVRVVCFDAQGKPTGGGDGSAERRLEYDARGNMTRYTCFGVDGSPVLCNEGYAEQRSEYDGQGNVTRILYFDANGKPKLHKGGYAECRFCYDERGERTDCSYFDKNGVMLKLTTLVGKVFAGTVAEQLGVKEGDWICSLGDDCLLELTDPWLVVGVFKRVVEQNRRMVIARLDNGDIKILAFDFPPGLMGLKFEPANFLPDARTEAIIKAYKAFVAGEKWAWK